jgi:hypothetical protein
MSNVVNLRMARKHKAREGKEQAAGEKRALFGRSKAQKERDRLVAEQAAGFIDGHRLERTDRDKPRP